MNDDALDRASWQRVMTCLQLIERRAFDGVPYEEAVFQAWSQARTMRDEGDRGWRSARELVDECMNLIASGSSAAQVREALWEEFRRMAGTAVPEE